MRKSWIPSEEKNNYCGSMGFIFYLADFISPNIPVSKHKVVKACGRQKTKSQPFFHFVTRLVWALSITLRPFVTGKEFRYSLAF